MAMEVNEADVDYLFDVLQMLKQAGCRMQDAKIMWCPDVLRQSMRHEDTGSNEDFVVPAKVSLRKLKTVLKSLRAISASLENTIEQIGSHFFAAIRSAGFRSLPDDVLARIFELHHEEARNPVNHLSSPLNPHLTTLRSSHVLASVCRRFRHIVLRIPALWEEVSDRHSTEWVRMLRERTQHPSVFISPSNAIDGRSISDYVFILQPSMQWRALDVRYDNKTERESAIECISTQCEGELRQLESLALARTWQEVREEDDTAPLGSPSTMLSEADDLLLSGWNLGNLQSLCIQDCIPYTLTCPNLRVCEVSLSRGMIDCIKWNVRALKTFLGGLQNLESLSLSLDDTLSFGLHEEEGNTLPPWTLSSLTSFSFTISYCDYETTFVEDFMDKWNAPQLSELSIYLQYCSQNGSDIPRSNPNAWLHAIFRLSLSEGSLQKFENVEKFNLTVVDTSRMLLYRPIFRGLPRVREVSCELPQIEEFALDDICSEGNNNLNSGSVEVEIGRLRYLRRLHLKNCEMMHGPYMAGMLQRMREKIGGGFERLEIEGCRNWEAQKERLAEIFAEGFIWTS